MVSILVKSTACCTALNMRLMKITRNVKYFSMLGMWFLTLMEMWFLARMMEIFLSADSRMLLVAVSTKMKLVSMSSLIFDVMGDSRKMRYVMSPLMRSICRLLSVTSSVKSRTSLTVMVSPSLEMASRPCASQIDRFSASLFSTKWLPDMVMKNSSVLINRMRLSWLRFTMFRSPVLRRLVRKTLLNLDWMLNSRSSSGNISTSRASNFRMFASTSSNEPNSGTGVSCARATHTTRKSHASTYTLYRKLSALISVFFCVMVNGLKIVLST
nr:MAG: hypothetical protein [Molluscum contagiosum virus]